MNYAMDISNTITSLNAHWAGITASIIVGFCAGLAMAEKRERERRSWQRQNETGVKLEGYENVLDFQAARIRAGRRKLTAQ